MTMVNIFSIGMFITYYERITSALTGKHLVIFITTEVDSYDFDFPVLLLDFKDVSRGEEGFIEARHLQKLLKVPYEKFEKIYVCCDGGISRSPAVGTAILKILGKDFEANRNSYQYRYMNRDVYDEIIESYKILRGI